MIGRAALVAGSFAGPVLAETPAAPAATTAAVTDSAESAKAGEPDGLEMVTVTARRREERLESVPIAVTAFSAAALEARDLKTLVDISRSTPSFQFQNQAGGGSGRNDRSINNLTFRGLALGNVTPTSQGGLLFIDGAPVINAAIPAIDDVERVEVLKGPQAAYFGRSTFSGAVNFVTKDPSFDLGGRIKAGYGTYGSNNLGGSLNIPIINDVLAVRVGASHDFSGGQYRNYADRGQVFGDRESNAVSAQILFKPTPDLRIKTFLSYGSQNDGPPAQAALKTGDFNCNIGGTYGSYYCGALPGKVPASIISANYTLNPYSYNALINNPKNFPTAFNPNFLTKPGLKRQTYQASVRADLDFGDGYTLTSISAYHRDKTQTLLDLDFRNAENIPNPYAAIPGAPAFVWWYLNYQQLTTDFSQELRITSPQDKRLRWTLGGSYFQAKVLGGAIYGLNVYGLGNSSTYTSTEPKTPAIFGAAYFDILPDLTLSAEGRYQWDMVRQYVLGTSSGVLLTTPIRFAQTDTSFSPRISLDYKFTDSSTVYGLFSRGYRPGGFNAALATQSAAVQAQILANGGGIAYNQERLDNYEIGFKSRFWDNKAAIRTAFYYDQYRDGQVSNSIPYFPAGSSTVNLLSVVQNIGSVNLHGVEFEGDLAPLPGLQFNATFGLNDSKIKSFVCQECLFIAGTTDATGNRLSGTPKYTWSFSTTYEHPVMADRMTAFGRMDYRHRGRQYADNANVAWSKNDDQIDLRLGLRAGTMSVEAFVLNVFDERTTTGVQSADLISLSAAPAQFTNDIRLALPDKRRIGVRASYDF